MRRSPGHKPRGLKPCGLSLALCGGLHIRDVRLYDSSPAQNTNVLSRDGIRQGRESAANTGELGLSSTIGFVGITAGRTCPGGVPRINQEYRDAYSPGFVADEQPQLEKGPTMQRGSLCSACRYPGPNALQVFQGNTASSALSMFHDAFANCVIYIGCKSCLSAGPFPEESLSRLCALLLQLLAESAITMTKTVHLGRGIDIAIRVGSNVRHTQVYTNYIFHVAWYWLLNLTGGEQIEMIANEAEMGLAPLMGQEFLLTGAADKGHNLTATQTPDGDGTIGHTPVQDAAVIGYRTCGLEGMSGLPIQFIGIGHLLHEAHNYLGRQTEPLSHVPVDEGLQAILAEGLGFPCSLTHIVAGAVNSLKRLAQERSLFRTGQQFHLSGQFHGYHYTFNALKCQIWPEPESGLRSS